MKNELKNTDYNRLVEFLKDNPSASIELFPGMDLEFMSISPLVITVEGFGYSINGEVSFQQPIGLEVSDDLKLDNEMRSLSVNYRNIKLAKVVIETSELESDLNKCLKMLERIVNQTCSMFDKLVEQTFTLNSEWLNRQLDTILRKRELEKRGEIARPFGTIHVKSWKDAKERAGDLVPIYMERDKAYLYEDKKVFVLLPSDFVRKVLKIQGSTMIPADQFTGEERGVLNKFSMRRYVKTRRIGGKIYYCNLDEKTRKLLLKGMKKRQGF